MTTCPRCTASNALTTNSDDDLSCIICGHIEYVSMSTAEVVTAGQIPWPPFCRIENPRIMTLARGRGQGNHRKMT